MGIYLNPGNDGFKQILRGRYVDKSGMIGLVNENIETPDKLICVSRPRRFGKSFAAKMMCAYYDKMCDSSMLFEGLAAEKIPTYQNYLNKFDVIYVDMTNILQKAGGAGLVSFIEDAVVGEIETAYPEVRKGKTFDETLIRTVMHTGNKFVMIIDEWDAPIRETPEHQDIYLDFLRMLFKGSGTTDRIFAAVYMTGILPVKKDGSQSAISDFIEYPILYPGEYACYTGFTEEEVQKLCEKYQMDFHEIKSWYDGYDFPEIGSVYNPYSVMSAVRNKKVRSYWQKTSAAESLMTYINMDFDGLQEITTRLIAGEEIEVNVDGFENDLTSFRDKDDVLTLLIHLGYLTYNEEDRSVHIPNEEVRGEFYNILRGKAAGSGWMRLINNSRKLLEDTLNGNTSEVEKAIEAVHDSQYAPTFYNDEQALRYVIKFAYIAALDHYAKVEELPSGHGIADVVYIPRRRSKYPAMIIELKWGKPASGAIEQIKEKNYPAVLKDIGGDIVLVGISYDTASKKHHCSIEFCVEKSNTRKQLK